MTPFERWYTSLAAELAKSDADAGRAKPTKLEQRIAIGLVQARAAECRAMAGQLQMQGLTLQSRLAASIAHTLTQQSHVYEQIALRLCDQYPPEEMAPADTCECGHTVSQHAMGEGGEAGPCSADCTCRGYRQKKLIKETIQ